jgi:hypothetical protein
MLEPNEANWCKSIHVEDEFLEKITYEKKKIFMEILVKGKCLPPTAMINFSVIIKTMSIHIETNLP